MVPLALYTYEPIAVHIHFAPSFRLHEYNVQQCGISYGIPIQVFTLGSCRDPRSPFATPSSSSFNFCSPTPFCPTNPPSPVSPRRPPTQHFSSTMHGVLVLVHSKRN